MIRRANQHIERTRRCPTDTDGDGDTDAADLAVLLGSWGPVDGGDCQDAGNNGLIDAFDLAVLLGAWGPCPL
ncbi:MAG: hypothetical protein IID41_12690 [Planctomycetes bacterium]|nr:hypothetical protein [Planctomycetota bacterium]